MTVANEIAHRTRARAIIGLCVLVLAVIILLFIAFPSSPGEPEAISTDLAYFVRVPVSVQREIPLPFPAPITMTTWSDDGAYAFMADAMGHAFLFRLAEETFEKISAPQSRKTTRWEWAAFSQTSGGSDPLLVTLSSHEKEETVLEKAARLAMQTDPERVAELTVWSIRQRVALADQATWGPMLSDKFFIIPEERQAAKLSTSPQDAFPLRKEFLFDAPYTRLRVIAGFHSADELLLADQLAVLTVDADRVSRVNLETGEEEWSTRVGDQVTVGYMFPETGSPFAIGSGTYSYLRADVNARGPELVTGDLKTGKLLSRCTVPLEHRSVVLSSAGKKRMLLADREKRAYLIDRCGEGPGSYLDLTPYFENTKLIRWSILFWEYSAPSVFVFPQQNRVVLCNEKNLLIGELLSAKGARETERQKLPEREDGKSAPKTPTLPTPEDVEEPGQDAP